MGDKDNKGKLDSLKNQVKTNIGKDISDDEIKKNTANIPVKNAFIKKNAMTISALIAIVGCFLPFTNTTFYFSHTGASVSSKNNGVFYLISGDMNSTVKFLSLIIFAIPIIVIIMNYIPALKKHRRKIALIGPAAGIICELILYKKVTDAVLGIAGMASGGASMKAGFGAIAIAAGFILIAIVGLFVYYGVKKDDFKK